MHRSLTLPPMLEIVLFTACGQVNPETSTLQASAITATRPEALSLIPTNMTTISPTPSLTQITPTAVQMTVTPTASATLQPPTITSTSVPTKVTGLSEPNQQMYGRWRLIEIRYSDGTTQDKTTYQKTFLDFTNDHEVKLSMWRNLGYKKETFEEQATYTLTATRLTFTAPEGSAILMRLFGEISVALSLTPTTSSPTPIPNTLTSAICKITWEHEQEFTCALRTTMKLVFQKQDS